MTTSAGPLMRASACSSECCSDGERLEVKAALEVLNPHWQSGSRPPLEEDLRTGGEGRGVQQQHVSAGLAPAPQRHTFPARAQQQGVAAQATPPACIATISKKLRMPRANPFLVHPNGLRSASFTVARVPAGGGDYSGHRNYRSASACA